MKNDKSRLKPQAFLAVFIALMVVSPAYASNQSECGMCDLFKDGMIDFKDFAVMASCWLVSDTTPPSPDPAQWLPENAVSYVPNTWDSIRAVALTATDQWMGDEVEYFFEWYTTSSTPYETGNSGWVADPNYLATGLRADTDYDFRVKTRDSSGNETGPAPPISIRTKTNNRPPYITGPGGVHWENADWDYYISGDSIVYTGLPYSSADVGAPYATIKMTAKHGTDPDEDDVRYRISRVNPENLEVLARNSENGLASRTWVDGEDPENRIEGGQTYTYMVTMIDDVGNESASSDPFSIICEHTPDDGDTTPPPVPEWFGSIDVRTPANDENCPGPGTWHYMEVVPSIDPQGFAVEYYFKELSRKTNSGWVSEPYWYNRFPGSGIYFYQVQVRDTSQRKNKSAFTEPPIRVVP